MQKHIIYEHPLNERIRTFLRLDFLFRQAKHFSAGDTEWDTRAVVTSIMDILTILGRADLRTEIIKELERNSSNLSGLLENSEVDHDQLKSILHWLERLEDVLQKRNKQLGQELRDDEFLNAIRQRSSIPGGSCDFDLPAYHQWLQRHPDRRREDLDRWLGTLDPVRKSVELILKLVRGSAEPRSAMAWGGSYQTSLNPNVPYQLIRILLPAEQPYFAEVSGGKHRFAVRFLEPNMEGRPSQTGADIEFQVVCCAL